MDGRRFDTLVATLARRTSRRSTLRAGTAALAAAALGRTGHRVAAQEATPAPATAGTARTEFLFVQSFEAGTFAPKDDGETEAYTLTLEHGLGQTVYFSDRPNRIVGTIPTQVALDWVGITPANPPNATLVMQVGAADEDVVVLELVGAAYDEQAERVTYDVAVLADYERLGTTFQEQPLTSGRALPPQFGTASLFIDGVGCLGTGAICQYNSDCCSGTCVAPEIEDEYPSCA